MASKNNSKISEKVKIVTSNDCEKCKTQCLERTRYLKKNSILRILVMV